MRIIAFIQSDESLKKILAHAGLPTKPPEIRAARDPSGWHCVDQTSAFDDSEPRFQPAFEFDQTVNW